MALGVLVVTLPNTVNSCIPRVCERGTGVLLSIAGPTQGTVQVNECVAIDSERALGVSVVDDGRCGATKGASERLQVGPVGGSGCRVGVLSLQHETTSSVLLVVVVDQGRGGCAGGEHQGAERKDGGLHND